MILGSPELNEFVVEPWMKLEPFDPKLIKKISLNHPYKNLLRILYKYYPSYSTGEGNDADTKYDGYEDVADFYFRMLDDYKRYGIAFERKSELFPDNKLGVIKNDYFEREFGLFPNNILGLLQNDYFFKTKYYLVRNNYDKKNLLFNNVKTIDLNDHDSGEKPLSEEEKQKRDIIKKQKNKKLQVAMMDPDIYNNSELFKFAIKRPDIQKFLIKKFNHRMTWNGFDDFIKEKFD